MSKSIKPTVLTHHWSISATLPSPDQRYPNYGTNLNLGIEAPTMERAMQIVRDNYPEAVFFGVHHRGELHLRG